MLRGNANTDRGKANRSRAKAANAKKPPAGRGRGKTGADLLKPPLGKPADARWKRSQEYSQRQQQNAKLGIKGAGVPPGKPLLEPPDFTDPKSTHDIVLMIENKKVYAHKALLSMFSPYFKKLFSGGGADMKELKLENTKSTHVIELLRVIYPPAADDEVTDKNVLALLKLADRFEMAEVTRRCEECMMPRKASVDLLVTAQTYNLQRVLHKCHVGLKGRSFRDLQREKQFKLINEENMVKLYGEKIKHLESRTTHAHQKEKIQQEKFEEIQQMFVDIKTVTAGPTSERKRDEIVRRVDKAMDLLWQASPDATITSSLGKTYSHTHRNDVVSPEAKSEPASSRRHDFDEYDLDYEFTTPADSGMDDSESRPQTHAENVDAPGAVAVVVQPELTDDANAPHNGDLEQPPSAHSNMDARPRSGHTARSSRAAKPRSSAIGRSSRATTIEDSSSSGSYTDSETESESDASQRVRPPSEYTNQESGYGTHSPHSLNTSVTKPLFHWDVEPAIPNVEGGDSLRASPVNQSDKFAAAVEKDHSSPTGHLYLQNQNEFLRSDNQNRNMPHTADLRDDHDFFDSADKEDLSKLNTWAQSEVSRHVNDKTEKADINHISDSITDDLGFPSSRNLNSIEEEGNSNARDDEQNSNLPSSGRPGTSEAGGNYPFTQFHEPENSHVTFGNENGNFTITKKDRVDDGNSIYAPVASNDTPNEKDNSRSVSAKGESSDKPYLMNRNSPEHIFNNDKSGDSSPKPTEQTHLDDLRDNVGNLKAPPEDEENHDDVINSTIQFDNNATNSNVRNANQSKGYGNFPPNDERNEEMADEERRNMPEKDEHDNIFGTSSSNIRNAYGGVIANEDKKENQRLHGDIFEMGSEPSNGTDSESLERTQDVDTNVSQIDRNTLDPNVHRSITESRHGRSTGDMSSIMTPQQGRVEDDWFARLNSNSNRDVHDKVANWQTDTFDDNVALGNTLGNIDNNGRRLSIPNERSNNPSRQSHLTMTPSRYSPTLTRHDDNRSTIPPSRQSKRNASPVMRDHSRVLPPVGTSRDATTPDWLQDLKGEKKSTKQSKSTADIPLWLKDNTDENPEEDLESLRSEFSFGKGKHPTMSRGRRDSNSIFPPLEHNQKATGVSNADILGKTF